MQIQLKVVYLKQIYLTHYSIFLYYCFCDNGITEKKSLEQNVTSVRKNISNFSKPLKKIDWNHLISENFQTSFSSFYRKFCDIFENNFPERNNHNWI